MYIFRNKHLLALLESYDESNTPIDFHVSSYFRHYKSLGSKDRAYIAEEVYRLIRWKGLIDHFLGDDALWDERLTWLETHKPKDYISDESLPEHVRASFPKELFDLLVDSWGERAFQIALTCNDPAPTFVRANLLKIERDALLDAFVSQGFEVSKGTESPSAIEFHKKMNFFILPEFKSGFFEVQDEASQLVADLISPLPQQQVLDFCAGSGGKTLAFAPKLKGTGQIFLHDVRHHALLEAKKRLKRAGIQNAQIVSADEIARLKKLKKRMDWVLVDAPCSGTGTLRRNPDMKWKFSKAMLDRLQSEQRVIFEQALSYLKPGGTIVYATCSIHKQENEEQVAHFLKTYSLEQIGSCFQSVPEIGKKDGFFAVQFKRREKI
jgi:16S rRNA (cytosine967-C5)-methyltransferase